MRFAVVNYNGQRQLICKYKLFFEYLELFFAAVSFVVIIEPDFTDCHHLFCAASFFISPHQSAVSESRFSAWKPTAA